MSVLTLDDLKELVTGPAGPCVSIYLPTHRAGGETRQDPIRLKNQLRTAEERLAANGHGETNGLLQPARALLDDAHFWRHQGDGLALFLAPDSFRSFRLPIRCEELVTVGGRFHVTPLLPLLTGDGRFYVLALSQHRVRLFEASRDTMRELDLEAIPSRLQDAVGYDYEQRSLQFRTAGGGGAGGRGAIFHGHGAGSDDKDDEMIVFLQRVDAGILGLLRDRQAPMVLAAAEPVLSTYREKSHHPNLVAGSVEGNPDDRSEEQLHGEAWRCVEPLFQEKRRRSAERFQALVGTGQAGEALAEVVLAACDGRVETLFLPLGEHRWGHLDLAARTVEEADGPGPEAEDLVDRSAVETLLHGGTVYPVREEEMPGSRSVAAVYRY